VIRVVIVLAALYVVAYGYVRTAWSEKWEQDGQVYVIFPLEPLALYYAFRPLSLLDGRLTGMQTHIGPHL
jgi:hypothetical protein